MESNQNKPKKKLKPLDIVLLCAAGALLIAGVFLTVRQFVFVPGDYVAPPVATAIPDSVISAGLDASADPSATPEVTPVPTPYVQLTPVRLYFVDREVMAEIQPVGLITEGEKAGKIATIDDALIAAWYEDGPSPGEAGNAIINGHVRWKGKAGTFSVLPDMKEGELVVIEYEDGSTHTFRVTSVEYYPYDDVPETCMDPDWGGKPRLSLISCTGDFNYDAGTSSIRVFVVCELVD